MIVQLMIYATEVAVLVSIAAWAVERIAMWQGIAKRGCWAAALVLSVGIPITGILLPAKAVPRPAVTPVALVGHDMPGRTVTAPPAPVQRTNTPAQNPAPESENRHPRAATLETSAVVAAWSAGTCGLFITYLFLTIRMRQAARNWRREQIDGQQVWITDTMGPAVYGFFSPIILLPEWLLQADGKERAAALAHERSHLEARDPALLLIGLLLVTLFPWNLPLWWQLRRLRFAIEVDCDARVLHLGMIARDYGSALLAIVERGIAAPIGAVALTEPASQLLRRIKIMTTEIAKPGKAAMLTAVLLASVCIGVAARTQAPTITTDLPRKLPMEESDSHPQIEALVRATYPQFFRDAGNTGPELVNLFLNTDGSLYKSVVEAIAPRPYITKSLQAFDQVGIDYEHRGPHVWFRMTGASGLPVDVIAWYFETPSDPTRDVATVRSKVRARYPDIAAEFGKVVTVLMTDGGEINHATVEDLNGRTPESLVTASHFASLGSPSNQLGLVGVTSLTNSHFIDDLDRKDLPVVYAWPRRANEPAMKFEVFDYGALPAPNDDRAVDRQIAQAYFPDLYTHPSDWPRADPWVLLDRQGKVLTTGRRAVMSRNDVKLNIESKYPGIKTDQWQIVPLTGPKGQEVDVSFVWIAADSAVTDPSKADFSKQPDVLINADVSSGDKTFYTQMLALEFGSSGVTQCALRNPFGVVFLQLAIAASDTDAAAVRIRVQHLPLPDSETIPEPVATAWSPQSAPVRALYSAPSAPIEITDANGKKWTIVLRTERLKHAPPTKS